MTKTAVASSQMAAGLRYGVFYRMAKVIRESRCGEARCEHFEVDAQASAFTRIRQAMNPGRDEYVPEGRYARLLINGCLVMSDTDMELRTNLDAVIGATGDVLIGGLGLGLVALAISRKKAVRSLTIIEKSRDVIALIETPLRAQLSGNESAGLVIFEADVARWQPGPRNIHRFDYIYLDIWSNICTDDYDEHKRLRARYRRLLKHGGKIASWQFEHLQDLRRSGR